MNWSVKNGYLVNTNLIVSEKLRVETNKTNISSGTILQNI